MARGVLPDDGPARIGSVRLPPGSRHYTERDNQVAAWVTEQPLAEAGQLWLALSDLHGETGLAPVLLVDALWNADLGSAAPPYFGFGSTADAGFADQMSAENVLAAQWPRGADDFRVLQADISPFGGEFPGLARAGDSPFSRQELAGAVGSVPPSHLGVVSAGRSADVPPVVGWSVFGSDGFGPEARSLEVATVLRSWEARFGARLLRIGSDATLQVLVERPPRSLDAARRVAAEHWAFADECAGLGLRDVESIAATIVNAPIWTFWWD